MNWQIYIFALVLVIIFALNAGTRPIVRIEEQHMTFYYAISGRIAFCYMQDIRYVEVKRHLVILHLRQGKAITSPYLAYSDVKKLIKAFELHHLYISHHER